MQYNNKKEKIKKILNSILLSVLVVTNIITLRLYLKEIYNNDNSLIENTGDELSRAKYFIKDWYDELSLKYDNLTLYKNELRFQNGSYTLTVAADRIRAVYPRGNRFFQLYYVTYIEFIEENGYVNCVFYYNETGRSIYKIN